MSRDLSAFSKRAITVPPPPPPPPVPASAPPTPQELKVPSDKQEAKDRRRSPGPQARPEPVGKPPRRIKVGVSVPATLHGQLRTATEERSCFKADVVLDALDAQAERLRQEHEERSRGGRTRSGRRRRVVDATPCELYLTEAERRSVDELAAAVGESRSAVVTRLLELELGVDDPVVGRGGRR